MRPHERFKTWLYERKFNRAVERYYRERLEPELAWVGERRCLKATRRRHVGLVDTRYGPGIVKIYYRRTGRLKNTLRAIELLDEIGLDYAKVWAVDQDSESMRRYRIASVVQEYIDGEDFDADRHRERLPSVARVLARMHGRLNAQCGELRGPFTDHFWRDRFRPMLRRKLDPLRRGPYCEAWPWARTIQAWFEAWGDRPGKRIGGWSFIHGAWAPGESWIR